MVSKLKEDLCRGIYRIQNRSLGHNEEFEKKLAGYNPSSFCAGFEYALNLCRGLISQIPDTEEVVRCKECEFFKDTWTYDNGTVYGYCPHLAIEHSENGYCHYGKRS